MLIVICLLVLSAFGFSRIKLNYSPIAFVAPSVRASSMNQFVVEGASYFLKSHSSYLELLQKIEISEIEYVPLGILDETANTAIRQMQDSVLAYNQLKSWAAVTPYNEDVINLLKNFNYMSFLQEQSLNSAIFWNVRDYLKSGDVLGIYDKMLVDSNTILKMLGEIEADLASGKIPKNHSLWKLNQVYLEALIFDQYVAMVFASIM